MKQASINDKMKTSNNNQPNHQVATDKLPNDQAEPRQTSGANQPVTEATKVDAAPAVGSGALFGISNTDRTYKVTINQSSYDQIIKNVPLSILQLVFENGPSILSQPPDEYSDEVKHLLLLAAPLLLKDREEQLSATSLSLPGQSPSTR